MDSDYHEGGSPSPSGGRRSRGGKPARHNSTSSTSSSTSSPTSSSAGSTRRRHPNQRRYACTLPTCTRSFTRLFNLKAHLETHNPARERGFRCEDCGVAFCRAQDLLRHGTVHDKSNLMTCPACPGKTFSRKDALRRHVRMNKCCELSDI
ncbi:hypothetical protein DFJ73DRAFT_635217 [Zopfochytrium polystomum]|nr:hypothetical protein DFJ73DRAFT_635217 [Zopfochytrium polystomum]